MANVYLQSLAHILQKLEGILGMYTDVDGVQAVYLPASSFFKYIKARNVKLPDEERIEVGSKCNFHLNSIAGLNEITFFNKICILDFSGYDLLDVVVSLSLSFTRRENLNKTAVICTEKLVKYLEVLEVKYSTIKDSMSYRILRLFLVFSTIGLYSSASIIANFFINQAFLSESVDEIIKQPIHVLKKSVKNIEALSKSYNRGLGKKDRDTLSESYSFMSEKEREESANANQVENTNTTRR